ncbi:uncharacterized protein DS421_8g243710 [Arachis hypogaea]|nr:uncharacterized protein DS421_8g243710 [Arachis hypogaea]
MHTVSVGCALGNDWKKVGYYFCNAIHFVSNYKTLRHSSSCSTGKHVAPSLFPDPPQCLLPPLLKASDDAEPYEPLGGNMLP